MYAHAYFPRWLENNISVTLDGVDLLGQALWADEDTGSVCVYRNWRPEDAPNHHPTEVKRGKVAISVRLEDDKPFQPVSDVWEQTPAEIAHRRLTLAHNRIEFE